MVNLTTRFVKMSCSKAEKTWNLPFKYFKWLLIKLSTVHINADFTSFKIQQPKRVMSKKKKKKQPKRKKGKTAISKSSFQPKEKLVIS